MNVLVVDDNSDERGLLLTALGAAGFAPFEASDGSAAFALLERERIDAIISDALLPPMDGHRLCYQLRHDQRYRHILFILYTSIPTSLNDEQFSLELGVDRLMRKPTQAKELFSLLGRLPVSGRAQLGSKAKGWVADQANLRLLNELPTPVWHSGLDGKCDYFNHTWLDFTGHTLAEELGDGWMNGVHAEDADRVRVGLQVAWPNLRSFRLEYRLRRADGEYRNMVSEGRTYPDPDGTVAGYIGACYDVTNSQRAKGSLKLFRSLIDQSTDSIKVIDPQTGHFLDVNEKGCAELGYSREEFLSLKVFDIDPSLDGAAFLQVMNELRHSRSKVWKGVHRRKNGTTFPVEVSLKYVQLDRDYVVAVALDVSERNLAAEALRNSAKQLRALTARLFTAREDQSVRLARAVHDELGHALTRLNMEVVFLGEFVAKDALQRPEILTRTQMLSTQVEEMVRSVQRIATELRPSLLDDLGLAAALEWQADQFAGRTRICCRWKKKLAGAALPDELSIVVFRIFQEVLNNIARHSHARTVDLSCSIESGHLILSVRDDGKGFDEKALSPNASLGLLGIREYTLLIGGSTEIQSAPGQGTTVRLTVPVTSLAGQTAKVSDIA